MIIFQVEIVPECHGFMAPRMYEVIRLPIDKTGFPGCEIAEIPQ
jgi:hypothetical protein